jgi:hypothetical protein
VIADQYLPLLEALGDERVGGLPAGEVPSELAAFAEPDGDVARLAADRRAEVLEAIERAVRARRVEWGARSLTQGEVLDAFAAHCREELDEVEVLAAEATRLALGWRRERAIVELRAGTVAIERLRGDDLLLLLCPVSETAVARLAEDQRLAARLATCDLVRLEKINAVRSSVFVYFEWFLRDAYGVKLLIATEFTRALVARGVLSLGMG